jgi:peptidoglycan-associated lipoprotein
LIRSDAKRGKLSRRISRGRALQGRRSRFAAAKRVTEFDFARAISSSHSDALITVEGFADPSGSTALNKRLGQRRADAVRDYLVTAGLPTGQVRAVSYGEDKNRQVRPGATGDAGQDNRRVALVVDYAGPKTSASTASTM